MPPLQQHKMRSSAEAIISTPTCIGALFEVLPPITLLQTNQRACMQSRIDNKYLVNYQLLRTFLKSIQPDYAVLEIDSKRQFTYRSCYFDDQYKTYFEHHQGRRQRIKVRTRHYVDGGGMKYLEVKLKGPRGITVKHRQEVAEFMPNRINGEQLAMLQDLYEKQYRKPSRVELQPAQIVAYRRITLVARKSAERVTIDFDLNFSAPGAPDSPVQLGSDFIIVETKSSRGNGIADSALKRLGIRQASSCSKYCIGVNLTNQVTKNNHFLTTIKRARSNILSTRQETVSVGAVLSIAV